MNCPNCGKDVGDSKFCTECGNPVETKAEEITTESKSKKKKSKLNGCGVAIVIVLVIIAGIIIVPQIAYKYKTESTSYVEISDTEVGLNDLIDDLYILSFKYNIKNISEKTIESMKITFAIYNEDGIEKATSSYTYDIILKPGESTDPDKFAYWESRSFEFEDVIIDGVYTVDYKSITIKTIEFKFSDETTDVQTLNYPVDEIYLRGTNGDVFYYVTRNDDGTIAEQCSTEIDPENGVRDIPEEIRFDDPYYVSVD